MKLGLGFPTQSLSRSFRRNETPDLQQRLRFKHPDKKNGTQRPVSLIIKFSLITSFSTLLCHSFSLSPKCLLIWFPVSCSCDWPNSVRTSYIMGNLTNNLKQLISLECEVYTTLNVKATRPWMWSLHVLECEVYTPLNVKSTRPWMWSLQLLSKGRNI
jgi:hypothetical protein